MRPLSTLNLLPFIPQKKYYTAQDGKSPTNKSGFLNFCEHLKGTKQEPGPMCVLVEIPV